MYAGETKPTNKRSIQHDDFPVAGIPLQNFTHTESDSNEFILERKLKLSHEPARYHNIHRFENTIEAKVEIGDTLQAIALRFHCTVADIKRLNKIDKDNEIYARKVIKIPVTVHNVLLDNFPIVHKSGNNSPKLEQKSGGNDSRDSVTGLGSIIRNPLEDAEAVLSEKLMVASVNSSSLENPKNTLTSTDNSINDIVLNSKITSCVQKYSDKDIHTSIRDDISAPLISHILDESTTNISQLHRIKGPSFNAMDWSGSDCDMSWICLFIVILALCFVIPLVYVIYIAEHSHHNSTGNIQTPHH